MAWICQECPDGTSCASTLAYFGCPFGHERLMHWEYEGGADPFDSCEWGAWRAVIDWILWSVQWCESEDLEDDIAAGVVAGDARYFLTAVGWSP